MPRISFLGCTRAVISPASAAASSSCPHTGTGRSTKEAGSDACRGRRTAAPPARRAAARLRRVLADRHAVGLDPGVEAQRVTDAVQAPVRAAADDRERQDRARRSVGASSSVPGSA